MSLIRWIVCVLFFIPCATLACTDIRVTAQDGTILVARSLEFALNFHSNLRTSPRGRVFKVIAPDGKPSLSWTTKYGYVGLDGLGLDIIMDGMNEEGLTFEELLFPGYAQYASITPENEKQALPYLAFGDWILGNFKTVDEVRQALSTVSLYVNKIPSLGDTTFPLHYAMTDASGKSIVVEYVKGQMHVYDNTLGVMTNSPSYDWQTTNILNYTRLSPLNPPTVKAQGIIYAVTGQGYGMIGLPGDISPPSRFVKSSVLLNVAIPAPDAAGALNLAEHIMNNVDVLRGEAREPQSGDYVDDITQWVVFKDITHKVFYFRTYGDMNVRAVSLSKLNLAKDAPRLKMPIARPAQIQDLTDEFLKTGAPPLAPKQKEGGV